MTTHLIDTLRRAARSPGGWVILALGGLAGWMGLNLAVLALGQARTQAPCVISGTAQTFAVLSALWVLASTLEADRRTPLRAASDLTAPGPMARLLGRWGGSALWGAGTGGLLALGLGAASGTPLADLSLYFTIVEISCLAAAWGLLLAVAWPGGPVVLLGALLFFAGHLPWGRFVWLLPGSRPAGAAPLHAAVSAAATAGLLLLALGATGRTART